MVDSFVKRIAQTESQALDALLKMYEGERQGRLAFEGITETRGKWQRIDSIDELARRCQRRVGVHWIDEWEEGTFEWAWGVDWDEVFAGRGVHFISWRP
jgi:hypothetical protein